MGERQFFNDRVVDDLSELAGQLSDGPRASSDSPKNLHSICHAPHPIFKHVICLTPHHTDPRILDLTYIAQQIMPATLVTGSNCPSKVSLVLCLTPKQQAGRKPEIALHQINTLKIPHTKSSGLETCLRFVSHPITFSPIIREKK